LRLELCRASLALPKDGKPVVDWKNKDKAFVDVAKGIRKAASFVTRHCRDAAVLESTVANPKYREDLAALDGKWDLKGVRSQETVIIVTGHNVITELLDRPTAEHLRDEVDKRGGGEKYRRALVVGCGILEQEIKRGKLPSVLPLISVGGPPSNDITKDLQSFARCTIAPGIYGSFRKVDGTPQAALWGDTAEKTRASVENYITRPEGLAEFLKCCWRETKR
jgi:hypothetical protein